MLLLDSVSRNEANDAVREEQNLHEIEVTLLTPRTVSYWRRIRACVSRCDTQTSPSVIVPTIGVEASGHL